ncbi:ABC transporter permease [Sphingomonas sp. BK580]|uniref:ABC transporter permease n=1 Tax=Sphingomonas sp. BK580 TaxID=2586972 RepID=UPI00161B054C|nr:ABC transporter permease [Sphingomonas sp. BK580]MBB3695165.1 ABC-2 type transport system permease protein [Sphingomonas sp. BK580]
MKAFFRAFRREVAHLRASRWDQLGVFVVPGLLLAVVAAMLAPGAMSDLPVVVFDEGAGPAARRIERAIDASAKVHVAAVVHSQDAALAMVRRNEAWAIVHLPADLSAGLFRSRSPVVRVRYQASYLSAGSQAASAVDAAIRAEAPALLSSALPNRSAPPMPGSLPPVEVIVLSNAPGSFEWYLGGLIFPAVLHLATACACAMALGRELRGESLGEWARSTGGVACALAGKMLPYVLAMSAWGVAWLLYLTLARGWHVVGSPAIVVVGQATFYAATASITCLLFAGSRELATTLSVSTVYAGSALAYSGATLPLYGASGFARFWSEVLPLTHYLSLQMGQFSGYVPEAALAPFGALCTYVLVAGLGATLLVRRQGAKATGR